MREELLQFIWKCRYFNHGELTTASGEAVYIYHPGQLNTHQGPDFLGARIRFGHTVREGPVELHAYSSDWQRHGHGDDPHYSDVILHVVWENDCIDPPAGIPILTLCNRTPKLLLSRYREWMRHQKFVPCESLLKAFAPPATDPSPGPAKHPAFSGSWSRQLLLQRLDQRTAFIRACLQSNRDNWELCTWWLMARSLGQPVNAEPFFAIARSLPLTGLLRHRVNPKILKALLLGQAGLLDHHVDDPDLHAEYSFYSAKYGLHPPGLPISFFRMRPAHFPTVRLSQLAALLTSRSGWFTLLRETLLLPDLHAALDPAPPEIHLGKAIKKSIVLNAFIPMLYAFGALRQEREERKKAIRWLDETTPERNAVLGQWGRLGISPANAAESQALLELRKSYCLPRRCLECEVGRRLLTAPAQTSSGTRSSPPCRDECCT